ncbi:GNAT family N-acetyltransferase [Bacillus lacus]|uniref:GNAT family N-acetyltransferase n=1 Tax=Metabacillus lacus TaxID=1983721 RepID=A0A7X2LYK8_9BACI|nr:GNAT family N-acetyltransferase [Metabacillus lacus]MRX71948.1 GNAT family N-acetyltransferase [Metabacillus lacus]
MNSIAGEMKEFTTEEEALQAWDIMKQLRTNLTRDEYLQLFEEMKKEGYRLFAFLAEGKTAAVAGAAVRTNFYDGKHLFVFDLVTDVNMRSRGYGEALLEYLHNMAEELDCRTVALTSGLQRKEAHRFYEQKMGYNITSYSFKKYLAEE